jgi:hypothetical protein
MAYIGNTVENQGFTPAIDYFNGDGVTVTFTLSRPIASVAQLIVAIDNVIQNPSSSFTVAGNAITFSSAPLSGTNNIWVEYTSLITTFQGISQDPTVIGDIRATGGYLAEGDFGNSFVAGAILDYVTGLGRITVGSAEGIALYNGGTSGRTALMTVAATGNVGIGTTITSNSKFTVVASTGGTGGIRIESQFGASYFGNYNNYPAMMYDGASLKPVIVYDTNNNANILYTNNTERMRIDSNGFLLVNTTTIRNSGRISADFNGSAAGGAGFNDTASANGSAFIGFLTGGTFRGSISNNNNAAVAYNTTSDYRLKENIAPMTGALATVVQLKPCTYVWKETGNAGQGFIAHELAEVVPDAVTGEKDAVDADENPKYQGVDTSFLVATLTAAIQELNAKVDAQAARIAALEAK